MQTAMTWQGQPVRTQVYDVQRDGYLLLLEDGTSTFIDRWTLTESRALTFHRPRPMVSFSPPAPRLAPPVPRVAPTANRTRVITDHGWGGGDARPRSRRLLKARHKRTP